ncbi:MAG TPA: DUF1404 family protein [Nitrososphaeraceae archaeon]|nr:DUF1404 family protein [Nitrososphaeraceae archaeon]
MNSSTISVLASELTLGRSLWLCLFGILIVLSLQSPILEITEQNLALHMVVEHTIFFFLGASSVKTAEILLRILVSHSKRKLTCRAISITKKKTNSVHDSNKNSGTSRLDFDEGSESRFSVRIVAFWLKVARAIFGSSSRYGLLWLSIPILLLAMWHYPPLFDYAVLHENFHILQHISFVIVGATAFIALRTLGESFKIIILIALNAAMAFGGLLLSVTTDPVYSSYSVNGHNEAGNYMIVTCILLLVIAFPAYLIHRTFIHIRIKIKEKSIDSEDSNV